MNNNTYIIAEIGQAHDGSLGAAHAYIDALVKTGINAIKFQLHSAANESSLKEKFRKNFSYQDKTRYGYWERIEFKPEEWAQLKKHCDDLKIDFICSPFSNHAIDVLENINTKVYKIASGEVSNRMLLDRIVSLNKKIIISSGLSTFDDLRETISHINKKNLSILQCTTEYPTSPQSIGIENIITLKKLFKLPTGLSDHSGKIFPSLSAVTIGADIIEVHATFDKRMFGPDTKSSLTIDEIAILVEGVRFIEKMTQNRVQKNKISPKFQNLKKIFGRSMIVTKDLKKGHTITIKDIDSVKPSGYGIDPKHYKKVLKKTLKKNMKHNDFLNYSDFT